MKVTLKPEYRIEADETGYWVMSTHLPMLVAASDLWDAYESVDKATKAMEEYFEENLTQDEIEEFCERHNLKYELQDG